MNSFEEHTNRLLNALDEVGTHDLPSLSKLNSLSKSRAVESEQGDNPTCEGWIDTYRFPKVCKSKLEHIRRFHIRRAMQVVVSIETALTVDGPLELSSEWYGSSLRADWTLRLASLDILGLLIGWIKGSTALCACLAFGQIESNLEEVRTLLKKCDSAGVSLWPPGCLGPSMIKRTCQYLMAPRRGNNHFVNRIRRMAENVLYVKRACPPMLPNDIDVQLAAHRSRVCRDLPVGPRSRWATEVRDLTKVAIRSIVEKLFDGVLFEPEESFPSLSSCFGNGIRAGGQLGEVAGRLPQPVPAATDIASLEAGTLEAIREVRPGVVSMTRQLPRHEALIQRMGARVTSRLGPGPVKTKPHALLEPCKVRVITISESAPYYRAAPVQKWLWSVITRCPTFRYVGKPIDEDWNELFDSYDPALLDRLTNESFVSGDFSAATDNLDPELSEYAWQCIASVGRVGKKGGSGVESMIDTPWYPLVKSCLTGHLVHYGRGKGKIKKPQTWGQLMGSPVSFPILNIVNAATTVVSLSGIREERLDYCEELSAHTVDQRAVSLAMNTWRILRHALVRTNGDDLFFLCPDDRYGVWKDVVNAAGLQPSLGKNYFSKHFAVMNSEMRALLPAAPDPQLSDTQPSLCHWQMEAFANLPILFGMDAKGPDAGKSCLDKMCWWELRDLALASIRGLPEGDPRIASRMKVFEDWHSPVLARVPAGVDWYVPVELGGLGLPLWRQRAIPLGVRQRATWLACLDVVKRTKLTTPPKAAPISLLDKLARDAMKPETAYRIVSSTIPIAVRRYANSNTDPMYGSWTLAKVLESIMAIEEVAPDLFDRLSEPCPVAREELLDELRALGLDIPKEVGPILDRQRREHRYLQLIRAQQLKVRRVHWLDDILDVTATTEVPSFSMKFIPEPVSTDKASGIPQYQSHYAKQARWFEDLLDRKQRSKGGLHVMSEDNLREWTTNVRVEEISISPSYRVPVYL